MCEKVFEDVKASGKTIEDNELKEELFNYAPLSEDKKNPEQLLLELSNIDFKANATYWKQANNQLELSNKLVSEYSKMIEQALEVLSK